MAHMHMVHTINHNDHFFTVTVSVKPVHLEDVEKKIFLEFVLVSLTLNSALLKGMFNK